MIDIQDFANEVNNAIATIGNINALGETNEQLKKEIEKIEKLMQENSILQNKLYTSETEINEEYKVKLTNLGKLGEAHLELKTKMQNLGYSVAGELLNNPNSTGVGVLATVGAIASTDKKESEDFTNKAINSLNQSKKLYLFKLNNKDLELGTILSEEILDNTLNQYEKNTNYTIFNSFNIIKGWYPQIDIKDFKKSIPNFKSGKKYNIISREYTGVVYEFSGNGLSKDNIYSYKLDEKNIIEIQEKQIISKSFSKESIDALQNKLLQIINSINEDFKVKPVKYSFKNTDVNSINDDNNAKLSEALSKMGFKASNTEKKVTLTKIEIVWTNHENKSFIFKADIIHSYEKNIVELVIEKTEKSI